MICFCYCCAMHSSSSCPTNSFVDVCLPSVLWRCIIGQTYEDSVRWLAHVERSMVPPALAAATAAARPSAAELRDAAAAMDSSADSSDRTTAGLVDVNLNTLSI